MTEEDVDDILKGKCPAELYLEKEVEQDGLPIKYFIFVRQPYTETKNIFGDLTKLAIENDDLFKGLHYISTYQYNHFDHRGTIIKGETSPVKRDDGTKFHESADTILKLSEYLIQNYNVKTTTYIGTQPLLEVGESETLNYYKGRLSNRAASRAMTQSILNLVSSHDINLNTAYEYDGGNHRRSDFAEEVASEFQRIFRNPLILDSYEITELRRFNRWVVQGNSGTVVSTMLAIYARFEYEFTRIFNDPENLSLKTYCEKRSYIDRSKRALDKTTELISEANEEDREKLVEFAGSLRALNDHFGNIFNEPHLSLGKIRNFMTHIEADLSRSVKKNSKDVLLEKVKALGVELETLSKNRNELAHGHVSSVFNDGDDDTQETWYLLLHDYLFMRFRRDALFGPEEISEITERLIPE